MEFLKPLYLYAVFTLVNLIQNADAMVISRNDLSLLFSEILNDLEEGGYDHVDISEKEGVVEPRNAAKNPDNRDVLESLKALLEAVNHDERDNDDNKETMPMSLQAAENLTAESLEAELVKEVPAETHRHDENHNEHLKDDLAEELREGDVTDKRNSSKSGDFDTFQPEIYLKSKNVSGEDGNNMDMIIHEILSMPTQQNNSGEQHGTTNHTITEPHYYAHCELTVNEKLESSTMAKYHRFQGTIDLRQTKSGGAGDAVITLYGLDPDGPMKHGVFIRQHGDLSNGCSELGPTYDYNHGINRSDGQLAIVFQDITGFAQLRLSDINLFDLHGELSIYGRAIVVYEDVDSNSAPIGCCVIGVSADLRVWN